MHFLHAIMVAVVCKIHRGCISHNVRFGSSYARSADGYVCQLVLSRDDVCTRLLASFPDSTPQLFIAPCDKKLGSGVWERGYCSAHVM